MRYLILALSVFFLFCNTSAAQSPPFSTITVSGTVSGPYDRVSLFESGESKTPLKTECIDPKTRQYSIDINIPDDMRQYKNFMFTDMRFWKDTNDNGVKDPYEPRSECHFIEWYPNSGKLYMQVYQGPRYEITSQDFTYNYGKQQSSSGVDSMVGSLGKLVNKSTISLALIFISGFILIRLFRGKRS